MSKLKFKYGHYKLDSGVLMKKAVITVLILTLFMAYPVQGVKPQKWELMRIEQFLEGKFDGISVTYEGDLFLSPREDVLQGPGEEFYLSMARTTSGIIFLGTGHSGRIYQIGLDGKSELYYQMPEMDVNALVWDGAGTLYAATSPNGKIYKITAAREGEPHFLIRMNAISGIWNTWATVRCWRLSARQAVFIL